MRKVVQAHVRRLATFGLTYVMFRHAAVLSTGTFARVCREREPTVELLVRFSLRLANHLTLSRLTLSSP